MLWDTKNKYTVLYTVLYIVLYTVLYIVLYTRLSLKKYPLRDVRHTITAMEGRQSLSFVQQPSLYLGHSYG
jgi:hypothetical protein